MDLDAVGPAGFMSADDERTMRVRAVPQPQDPLHRLLTTGGDVGTIVTDRRCRMRVNGVATPTADGFTVHTDQVFSNCGRYISDRRHPCAAAARDLVGSGTELSDDQMDLVRGADTFFIGTCHTDGASDASHRAGNPGFVQVDSPDALRWPDYDGNAMFMTLGNLAVDPRVGLLFVDWAQGALLHLSGRACLDWDERSAAALPGAQRVVGMSIDAVLQRDHAAALSWTPPVLSRFNPTRRSRPAGERRYSSRTSAWRSSQPSHADRTISRRSWLAVQPSRSRMASALATVRGGSPGLRHDLGREGDAGDLADHVDHLPHGRALAAADVEPQRLPAVREVPRRPPRAPSRCRPRGCSPGCRCRRASGSRHRRSAAACPRSAA